MLWMYRTAETVVIPSRSARGRSFHTAEWSRERFCRKTPGRGHKNCRKKLPQKYPQKPCKGSQKHGGAQENQRKAGNVRKRRKKSHTFAQSALTSRMQNAIIEPYNPLGIASYFIIGSRSAAKRPKGADARPERRRCAAKASGWPQIKRNDADNQRPK